MSSVSELLPFTVGPEMPVALAAVAAFVAVIALWQALRVRDPIARRAKSIATREDELRSALLGPRRRMERSGGTQSQALMAQVVARLKLMQGNKTRQIRERLAQGGFRSHEALVTYLFCKLTLPAAFGAIAVLLLEVLKLYDLPPMGRLVAAVAAVVFGAFAPELWIKNVISKRRQLLEKQIPDGLDLLVICVEAGLSLDAALKRISDELRRGAPELADELTLTSVELSFLPERAVALRNLAQRAGLKSIGAIVNALLQTEKFGTPLAQSLRVLAGEFRNQRLLRAEEKAARLPVILTLPTVMFILPALFIVLIGPGVLKVIDGLRSM